MAEKAEVPYLTVLYLGHRPPLGILKQRIAVADSYQHVANSPACKYLCNWASDAIAQLFNNTITLTPLD